MELSEIAAELIKLNPKMRISGSVALNIQGIKTSREPHDLDMFLPFGCELVLLPGLEPTEELRRYGKGDGGRMEFIYNGSMVDIFQPNEEIKMTRNPTAHENCLIPAEIIKFKIDYAFDNHETAKKHRDDIIFILSNYEPKSLDIDLPF